LISIIFIPFSKGSQLQDWNMERNDLEARRQNGELENGNAEE